MRKRQYILFSTLLFLCVVIYILYPTDEKQIRKIINNSEEAIVYKDIAKLMDVISFNYRDDQGNGYLQIKKIMQLAFKRLDNIKVEKNIVKISVKENYAEAELSVRVSASEGEEAGYFIGDAGKAEPIKVFFEKSPHKWLITKVEGGLNIETHYGLPNPKPFSVCIPKISTGG